MAQVRYFDFEADDQTLFLNEARKGLFRLGVQRGFNVVPGSTGGMWCAFQHDPDLARANKPGTDGATGLPAARTLTSVAGGFSAAVAVGDILVIEDYQSNGDNGAYIVTGVPLDTQITVNRDWPVGSLAALNFVAYKALGVFLPPDHAWIGENACQDNLFNLPVGGGTYRIDVLFASYTYALTVPPPSASYFRLAATMWAGAADGATSAVGTRTLTSLAGGFLVNVARGDILRINDTGTPGDNGEYTVEEVVNDTTLLVNTTWKAGGQTALTFTVYRLPPLTVKDTVIAYVEVPAGAVTFSQCLVRKPDYLGALAAPTRTVAADAGGVLEGLSLANGTAVTDVSVQHGVAVTGDGVYIRVEADQTNLISAALCAAGNHRFDRVVLAQMDDGRLPLQPYQIVSVTGAAVLAATVPVVPTDGAVITALQSLDMKYRDIRDVVDLGHLHVTDAAIVCHTRHKLDADHEPTVKVLDRRGAVRGTFSGALALDEAMDYVDAEYLSIRDVFTNDSTTAPITVEANGHFVLREDLVLPSGVELRGPVSLYGTYNLVCSGRSFVGDHAAASWVAAALPAPPDLPAGHTLYQIDIAAALQIGNGLPYSRLKKYDPVDLYDPATATMFRGWLYAVLGNWSMSVILPNTYVVANNTGSVRVLKKTVRVRDASVANYVEVRHGEDVSLDFVQANRVYVKQNRKCDLGFTVLDSVANWDVFAGFDSDFGFGANNRYDIQIRSNASQTIGRNDSLSVFDRIVFDTTVAGVISLGGTGMSVNRLQILGFDPAAVTPSVSVTGSRVYVGHAELDDCLLSVEAAVVGLTVSRVDCKTLTLVAGCSQVIVSSYRVTGTLTNSTTGAVLLAHEHDSRTNQDRNLRLVSTANISWNATTGALSWTAPLRFDLPFAAAGWNDISLASSPQTLGTDGDRMVVTLQRTSAGAVDVAPSVVHKTAPLADGNNTVIVALRFGTSVYLCDGTVLETGQTVKLGQTPPPDGSVTYEKLADSAKAYSVDALGDYAADPVAVVETEQAQFRNETMVGFNWAGMPGAGGDVIGTVQFVGAVDLSGVMADSSFIDAAGVRHRVMGVDDALNRVYLQRRANVTTVPVLSQWHGAVVSGPLHFSNTGLTAFTHTRPTPITRNDGATGVGPTDIFTSGAGGFTGVVRVGATLIVNDAGTPGDNGVYRVIAVPGDTQVQVDRVFAVGGLAALTFTLRWSEAAFGVAVNLPIADGVTTQYLFWDTAGTAHRILGKTAGDMLTFDYNVTLDTSAPSSSSHGKLTIDNNPRSLPLADVFCQTGISRVLLSEPYRVNEYGPQDLYASPNVRGGDQIWLDARDQRIRYGGRVDWSAADGTVQLLSGASCWAEFTFYGNGAVPLIRGTTAGTVTGQVWIDGRLVKTNLTTDVAVEPHSALRCRLFTRAVMSPAASVGDEDPAWLATGVHTMRILRTNTSETVLLYGFDVVVQDYQSSGLLVGQGDVFIDGKQVTRSAATKHSAALPAVTWKGGTSVWTVNKQGTVTAYHYDVPDKTQATGDTAVASPTISNVNPDPVIAGFKFGDMITVESGGSRVLRYIIAIDPAANTITTDENIGFLSAGAVVRFYGSTWMSLWDVPSAPERKTFYPVTALSMGAADGGVFYDVDNVPNNVKSNMFYVAGDGSTCFVGWQAAVTEDAAGKLVVLVYDDPVLSFPLLRFGWYGTGLDLHVPYETSIPFSATFEFTVYIDGHSIGSHSVAETGAGAWRVCEHLPMGYHVIQISPSVAAAGANAVFMLSGITVRSIDAQSAVPDEVIAGVMDRPGEQLLHLAATALDPGRGWDRHYPYRDFRATGTNISMISSSVLPGGHALQMTDATGTVTFSFFGTDFVVRGTKGTCDTYIDGQASAFAFETVIARSNWGWHTIKIVQTGAGVATVISAIDVRAPGATFRPLADRLVHRNDVTGCGTTWCPISDGSVQGHAAVGGGRTFSTAAQALTATTLTRVLDTWTSVVVPEAGTYEVVAAVRAALTAPAADGELTLELTVDGHRHAVSALQHNLHGATAPQWLVFPPVFLDLAPGVHSFGLRALGLTGGVAFDLSNRRLDVRAVNRLHTVRA